ncbi:uncharacterized protein LOC124915409 [Impatiens glandulifera]|uniref:uncharacterized protein LOC124915409 n=1 Tax=Impatiens glandulifera TaxID=253017 RepID=UPI001FB0E6E9|nr:uncharacterized protein LOC124915409 [Impatiens glandulifera]
MESMYSGMGSEMLGLEMSLHHRPQQNPNSHHQLHLQHSKPQMVSFGDQSHNQAQKPGYSSYTPNKVVTKQITLNSDDDEPDSTNCSDGKMKNNTSPWQRMKWTDSMVKLLIMIVFYIGDEVGSDGTDPAGKKKAGGGGMLQKKGKWKTVSKAMMERGYYVSPQQCEDKFNDLNKRYKRVNDILGKGTSCKVVENQSLLDQMDHLSQKLKDEVKKLLNSKHLFFREMCAYHNSCGHGGAAAVASAAVAAAAAEKPAHSHSHSQPQLQEKCLHETEVVLKLPEEEDEEEDNDETLDDEDDDEVYLEDEQDGHDQFEERNLKKRARKEGGEEESGLVQQLSNELMGVVEDGRRSEVEKRRWLKGRLLMLEEQRVSFNVEAFELEKQRLKWEKFSGKKEREMEREKIKNERCKLETDRMILMLRKKGLELAIQQPLSQYSSSSSEKRRMEPSSTT